jgi:hypothetical protein
LKYKAQTQGKTYQSDILSVPLRGLGEQKANSTDIENELAELSFSPLERIRLGKTHPAAIKLSSIIFQSPCED